MNRIEKRMQELQQRGEKALITYITAGLPDMEGTKKLIRAQEEAGVDVVELGIPFSDPVADGPVIQDASYRSILKGTTLRKVLAMVKELRAEGCEQPLIFMMYYNTVMSYGVQNFADACVEIGIDGLIIPDLPDGRAGRTEGGSGWTRGDGNHSAGITGIGRPYSEAGWRCKGVRVLRIFHGRYWQRRTVPCACG